jgi:hypothetical protein
MPFHKLRGRALLHSSQNVLLHSPQMDISMQ